MLYMTYLMNLNNQDYISFTINAILKQNRFLCVINIPQVFPNEIDRKETALFNPINITPTSSVCRFSKTVIE